MAAFAATFVRSPTSLDASFCMTHVLTAVRSMCVLRMSFSTSFHRPSTTSRSGTQLSTSLKADVPGSAAEAVYGGGYGRERYDPVPPRVLDGVDEPTLSVSHAQSRSSFASTGWI